MSLLVHLWLVAAAPFSAAFLICIVPSSPTFLLPNFPLQLSLHPEKTPFFTPIHNFFLEKKDEQAISKLFYTSTYLMGGLRYCSIPKIQYNVQIGFWRLLWHQKVRARGKEEFGAKNFPFSAAPNSLSLFSPLYGMEICRPFAAVARPHENSPQGNLCKSRVFFKFHGAFVSF